MANVVKAERKLTNICDEKHPRMADCAEVVFDDGLVMRISPFMKKTSWDGMTDEDAVADAVKRATGWRRRHFDGLPACKPVLERIKVYDLGFSVVAELTMSFGGKTMTMNREYIPIFRDILRAVRNGDGNEDLKMTMDLLGTPEAPTPEEFTAYVRTAGAKALTAALSEMKDRIVFGEDSLRYIRLACISGICAGWFEESPIYGVHTSAWFEDEPDDWVPLS